MLRRCGSWGSLAVRICPFRNQKTALPRGLPVLVLKRSVAQRISCSPERFSDNSRQAHNESRSKKVGSSYASSDALQNTDKRAVEKTHRNIGKCKTKYACVVDADESTRPGLEGAGHKPHQDHITAIGMNSMTHYKATVEKEWEKLEKIRVRQLTEVTNKKEVIDEARVVSKSRRSLFCSSFLIATSSSAASSPIASESRGTSGASGRPGSRKKIAASSFDAASASQVKKRMRTLAGERKSSRETCRMRKKKIQEKQMILNLSRGITSLLLELTKLVGNHLRLHTSHLEVVSCCDGASFDCL